jgi:hypothetical protein
VSDPHQNLVRQAFERYVAALPGLATAYIHNAEVHAVCKYFERSMTEVDRAMKDEGLDEDARARVFLRALPGRPSPEQERARLVAMREFGIGPNG